MLHLYINCATLVILLLMSIQDFKYRGIFWFNFPMLGAFLGLSRGTLDALDCIINTLFICVVYVLLSLWFSLRSRKFVDLLAVHIGLGDLLFLLCLAIYFPFPMFFAFYLGSLVLVAVGLGIYLLWHGRSAFTVPLAGLQSILLLALMAGCWLKGIEPYQLRIIDKLMLW